MKRKKTVLLFVILTVVTALTACSLFNNETVDTGDSLQTGEDSVSDSSDESSLTDEEIAAIVDENLDILMLNSDTFTTEQEFIDAHPDAFAAIVSLGKEALPYLTELSQDSGSHITSVDFYRCGLAMYAAYTIQPELYDLVYPSPNKKHALKANVHTFLGVAWGGGRTTIYDNVRIIDCDTNDSITTDSKVYTNLQVEWSHDTRYVAVQSSDLKFYTRSDIFDVKKAEFVSLPSVEEVECMIGHQNDINILQFGKPDYTQFIIDEWLANDKITIHFFFRYGYAFSVRGKYTYDLIQKQILTLEHIVEDCGIVSD